MCSTGWFNDSIAFTQVPFYHADGSYSFRRDGWLPPVLTGPEYQISTIDRLHLLRHGTICGDLLKEDCEERLPDAKYIFRVTGALSKSDTTNTSHWHFCGVHGDSMTELEFQLVRGRCIPGVKITSHELCFETPLLASFEGTLTLSNVGVDSLSEFDVSVLENDLAESVSSVVPGLHNAVNLDSWSVSGSDLVVYFSIKFDPIVIGLNGVQYGDMEALAEQIGTASSSYVGAGSFLKFLQDELLQMPTGSKDILSAATGAVISEVTYTGTAVIGDKTTGAASAVVMEPAAADSTSFGSNDKTVLASFQKSMLLLGVALCGVVLVVYVSSKLLQQVKILGGAAQQSELLPADSSRDFANTGIDISERTPNWN